MGHDKYNDSGLTLQERDGIEHESIFGADARLYDATPLKSQAVLLAGNALDQFFGYSCSAAKLNEEKKKQDQTTLNIIRGTVQSNAALFNFQTLVRPALIAIGLNGVNEVLYIGKRQLMDKVAEAINSEKNELPEKQQLYDEFNATLDTKGAGKADNDMIGIDDRMADYIREHGGHVETIQTSGFHLNLIFFQFSTPGTTIHQASVGAVRNARDGLKQEIDQRQEQIETLRDAHARILETDNLEDLPERQRRACHGLCHRNRLHGRTAGEIMETGMPDGTGTQSYSGPADTYSPAESMLPAFLAAVVMSMNRSREEPEPTPTAPQNTPGLTIQ